ncbi:MAG: Uma2 family endonuclease [Methylomonas sp.]|nr:Uma2 family endonuclease [Methylomonas sp.]
MALKQAHDFISEAEYLQGEILAEIRHEYIDGEVFAMAGTSRNHNILTGNVARMLGDVTSDGPCMTFSSEIKVKTEGCFFYPDVMVVCDDDDGDDYYTEKPKLIVEVLSKTTRKMDKTTKLMAYKTLPSLQEYVLIEQDHVEIEVFRRSQNWFAEHYFLGDELYLQSVGLTVGVADIYRRVDNEDMRDYLQQQQEQTS